MNTRGRPTTQPRCAFGERLLNARKRAGLSQIQLAEKLGSSQRVIAHWERHSTALYAEQLSALCQALHVSADELLGVGMKKPLRVGRPSKLDICLERAKKLPKVKQEAIVQMVEALSQKE